MNKRTIRIAITNQFGPLTVDIHVDNGVRQKHESWKVDNTDLTPEHQMEGIFQAIPIVAKRLIGLLEETEKLENA